MIAMGLNTEEEGSPMAFFRRGYKVRMHECRMSVQGPKLRLVFRLLRVFQLYAIQTSTWWEDAYSEEESHEWRR